jgi:hypothetical protein
MMGGVKNLLKIDQTQNFDQLQKPAKWAQLLSARIVSRRSIDFSCLSAISFKTCTRAPFCAILSFFYFLPSEYLLSFRVVCLHSLFYRIPRWFSTFEQNCVHAANVNNQQ